MSVRNALLGCFLVLTSWSTFANTLQGRVVGISDGDTVTILGANNEQHKIRLGGIDAPEKAQPYGQKSKASLSALAFEKVITVEWTKKDRYGRIIGKLLTPDGQDLNLEQIRRGMAWHYKYYEREQYPADRLLYSEVEKNVREKRIGLWADVAPEPPWDFRRVKRNGSSSGLQ